MPPRKRVEPKPAPPVDLDADSPVDETAPPEGPARADAENEPEEPSVGSDDPDPSPDGPKKSDLQASEQPCSICIPNGWTEGAFSMGCEHGTWIRDNT